MPNIWSQVWRVNPTETVIDGIIFVWSHHTFFERRAKLRNRKDEVSILKIFDISGCLVDGRDRECLREAMERKALAGIREQKQYDIHDVPGFPEMVALRYIPFHDVPEEQLK
jgi:hypothetical protein